MCSSPEAVTGWCGVPDFYSDAWDWLSDWLDAAIAADIAVAVFTGLLALATFLLGRRTRGADGQRLLLPPRPRDLGDDSVGSERD